jgi:hypothetical protein
MRDHRRSACFRAAAAGRVRATRVRGGDGIRTATAGLVVGAAALARLLVASQRPAHCVQGGILLGGLFEKVFGAAAHTLARGRRVRPPVRNRRGSGFSVCARTDCRSSPSTAGNEQIGNDTSGRSSPRRWSGKAVADAYVSTRNPLARSSRAMRSRERTCRTAPSAGRPCLSRTCGRSVPDHACTPCQTWTSSTEIAISPAAVLHVARFGR